MIDNIKVLKAPHSDLAELDLAAGFAAGRTADFLYFAFFRPTGQTIENGSA